MKRCNQLRCSNTLMVAGLIVMFAGVAYSVVSQFAAWNFPDYLAHASILAIFLGAIIWLAGARIGGRERVADRYWWIKNYDKRCRRNPH